MQNLNVYSIYDVKANCYGNVFTAVTDGIAIRVFEQIIQFGGNPDYQRYPEDFSLHCVGEFLDSTGDLTPCRARLVTSALALMQSRGAAVGGDSPLKSQSASNADSADAVPDIQPACDVESESTQSKAEVKNA